MKLSTEAKVAAAVAVAFAALSIGAIAEEQGETGTGGPNGYHPTGTKLTYMSVREPISSLSGRSANEATAKFLQGTD